jgi:hypothetical protein
MMLRLMLRKVPTVGMNEPAASETVEIKVEAKKQAQIRCAAPL